MPIIFISVVTLFMNAQILEKSWVIWVTLDMNMADAI